MRTGGRGEGANTSRRATIAASFGAAIALNLLSIASAADPPNVRRVVVLYPVSDGQPGIIRFDEGLRTTFETEFGEPIEIYNEYLDAARFSDDAYQSRLADFLREKYAGRTIDVVIPAMATSLDFVLSHRDHLFTEVPVVFAVFERREVESRTLGPGITGTPMWLDLRPTLEAALRLQPRTRRVVVVAGRSATDSYWVGEARKAFQPFQDRLDFVYLTGLPMDELLNEVAHLPDRTIVYYLHVFEDGRGRTFIPASVADRLAGAANAPVYGLYDTFLGRGIVGGRLTSFEAEGVKAARMAMKILSGQKPEAVAPPAASENAYMFDWRQLRRWGIGEDRLPSGSVVVAREPDFWELYRWRIIAILSLCAVEAALIVGLLWERARRRHADERFRQAVAASPSGMVMIGRDGKVVLANPHAECLFGYRQDELVGNPVEMLLPERFRLSHHAHRDGFLASPTSRPMGEGRDLYGRRKDGSEFLVEISLNPIRAGGNPLILVSLIDVTERRRANESLEASRRELQALTGRLLQAQEAEQRRIARDLHDDLNQELALLAVHLELLARDLPASSLDLGERLKALSDRVKAMSTFVHDLSTLLHPSKLEQLGLVAAIRGLCGELADAHGLTIEFESRSVAPAIRDEVALCLYRIAQESLRNVVKHSGSRRARVELDGDHLGICLRIADDGVGFDGGTPRGEENLGLISMRERLMLVGGTILIDSRPMGGTRIETWVPLHPDGVDPESPRGEATAPRPSQV